MTKAMQRASALLHQPVMPAEVIAALNINPNGIYVDATFGRGGHSRLILERLSEQGRLIAFDQDQEAVNSAHELAQSFKQLRVHHCSFRNLSAICAAEDIQGEVNGLLMDLGVCSTQLDQATRGFSFNLEGPLDMRMDPSRGISAAEWIHQTDESEMAFAFKTFGEERFAKRIAKAIVKARDIAPIQTTTGLAEIVKKAHPAWEKHKHPATRVFQAIRILINAELDTLKAALDQVLEILAVKGRLVVISFHSLEDRIIKQFIRKQQYGEANHHKMPWLLGHTPCLEALGRSIKATDSEVSANPRARSAILRVAAKVGIAA